jgi:hydroxyacylglutathione hydrolase
MHITPVPCLKDNYAYLIHADGSDAALVVDPSEAAPVVRAVEAAGLRLVGILNTHHHFDHVGGNEELLERYSALPVFGYSTDRGRIPGQTVFLEHEGTFESALLEFRALHIPGHTLGAVAYIVGDAVFTGDTMFAAGCGRLFEGTPAQMYESLNVKLGSLPDSTRVFFGHEYTAKNLEFAAHVEPGNQAVREIRRCGRRRKESRRCASAASRRHLRPWPKSAARTRSCAATAPRSSAVWRRGWRRTGVQ